MEKLKKIARWGALLILIAWLAIGFPNYPTLTKATNWGVQKALQLTNIPTETIGSKLYVDLGEAFTRVTISAECAGIALFTVFFLALCIVPKFSIKDRLIALLFVPLLFLGNVARIWMGVVVARKYDIAKGLFFHDTIGQVFIFAYAIIILILWWWVTGNLPKTLKKEKEV